MITSFTWDENEFDFDKEMSSNQDVAAGYRFLSQEQDEVSIEYSTDHQLKANVLHAVSVLNSDLLAEAEVFENVVGGVETLFSDIACTVDVDGLIVSVRLEDESRDIIDAAVNDALDHLVDCVKYRIHYTGDHACSNMELHEMATDELVLALLETNSQRRAYVADVYADVGCIGVTAC